jgi:hypothetical protein
VRARMALALGKLNFSCAMIGLTFVNRACRQRTGTPKFRGSGNLVPRAFEERCEGQLFASFLKGPGDEVGVPVVNFPRANARAQALLWVRDWEISGMDYFRNNC